MKLKRFLLVPVVALALVLVPASTQSFSAPSSSAPPRAAPSAPLRTTPQFVGASAAARDGEGSGGANGSRCVPGQPDVAPETKEFYGGNPLLGPAQLPVQKPVGPLLTNFRRFGSLDSVDFLAQYYSTELSRYTLPPANGFVIQSDGLPIKFTQALQPGTRLDRFGFPSGRPHMVGGQFLSPLGTPFAQRALPPTNLNTPAGQPLANYHVYCVVKPFAVDTGPITQWFAEPSLGTQYKLEPAYLPECPTPVEASVSCLITNGYLVEERAPLD